AAIPTRISVVLPAVVIEQRVVPARPIGIPRLEAQSSVARIEVVAEVVVAPSRPGKQRRKQAAQCDGQIRPIEPTRLIPKRLREGDRGKQQPAVFQRTVPVPVHKDVAAGRPEVLSGGPNPPGPTRVPETGPPRVGVVAHYPATWNVEAILVRR